MVFIYKGLIIFFFVEVSFLVIFFYCRVLFGNKYYLNLKDINLMQVVITIILVRICLYVILCCRVLLVCPTTSSDRLVSERHATDGTNLF